MKKVAILFLLFAFFYNALGIYLMVSYKEEQSWVSMMQKIPDAEFKIIRLNTTIYTSIEDSDFEYLNEDMVIENKVYHIFKKRIQNGILNLYYLRNYHQNAIGKKLMEVVNNQTTNPANESPVKKILKSFLKTYVVQDKQSLADVNVTEIFVTKSYFNYTKEDLQAGHLSINSPPPDFV